MQYAPLRLFVPTCLLVLLLPNAIVLAEVGGVTVYMTEFLVWAVFVPALGLLLLMRQQDPVSCGLLWLPEAFLYVGFCAAAAVIALGYDGSGATIGKVKNILPGFFLSLLVMYSVRTVNQVTAICLCLVAGALLNAILGIMQFGTGALYVVEPLSNNEYKLDFTGDPVQNTAHGLFPAPNGLGIALVPGFVVGVRLLFCRHIISSVLARALLMLSLLVIAVGIYVSFTRGAVLWSLCGLVVAFAPFRRKLEFAGAMALGLLILLILSGIQNMNRGDAVSSDTLVTRMNLWAAAWDTVVSNPHVLLYGDSGSQMAHNAGTRALWSIANAHNTWIDQVLLFGLGGFGAYLLLWLAVLTSLAARSPPDTRHAGVLRDAVLGALTALLGVSVLEPLSAEVYAVGITFVLFGLGVSVRRHCKLLSVGREGAIG